MAILLTIPPEGKLVAKLFSEPTPSGIAKQQTAQHPTGAIEASVDVADGEIQPGGDFAEFKPAVVAEEQYLAMPVMQHADQSHQFGAGFRKDQRVERARVVLGQEDGLDATNMAAGLRRLGNDARLLVRQRLGSRLLDVLSRVAARRGNPLQVSERGLSQIRQQVCHLGIEGVSNE